MADFAASLVYVHKNIAITRSPRPIISAAVICSFHIIRLTRIEISSELLPIRVVTVTDPVLIAAVLNKIKQVCVRP